MRSSNCLICLLLVLPLLPGQEWSSWRGSAARGVFPAHGLVTSCNSETGENIVWKTELPYFGSSSPVYADGKVFVLCDPGWKHEAPQLLAVKVADGAIVWQQSVDNLDARPAAEADPVRAWRSKEMAMARQARAWMYEYRSADAQRRQEIVAAATAAGHRATVEAGTNEVAISFTSANMPKGEPHSKEHGEAYKNFAKQGLFQWEGWYYGGVSYTGLSYPSAVCDTVHVYVFTNNNAVACFDFAGKRRWLVDVRLPPGGHGGGPINTASPTLVGDTLIVGKFDGWVALDKNSGKELWRHDPGKLVGAYQPGSAAVHVRVENKDYVYVTSGELLRLQDGGVAGRLRHPADVRGEKRSHGPYFGAHAQSLALVDKLLVCHSGYGGGAGNALGGLFVFQLAHKGNELDGTLLWEVAGGGDNLCIAVEGDNVYRNDTLHDLATGKVLKKASRFRTRSPVFSLSERYLITAEPSHEKRPDKRQTGYRDSLKITWWDKTNLTLVGEGVIHMDPAEGERLQKRISRVRDEWPEWGNSSPMPWGNRVFVRSNEALYCIGDPKVPFKE